MTEPLPRAETYNFQITFRFQSPGGTLTFTWHHYTPTLDTAITYCNSLLPWESKENLEVIDLETEKVVWKHPQKQGNIK